MVLKNRWRRVVARGEEKERSGIPHGSRHRLSIIVGNKEERLEVAKLDILDLIFKSSVSDGIKSE